MIIAVNTRLQQETQPDGYEDYLFELLDRVTGKFPQHEFLYIFDKPYTGKYRFRKNVLPVITGPVIKTSLHLQYWFNFKIPAVLRKHRAAVFVSMEGICSMRTQKPQVLLISDLGFLLNPGPKKKRYTNFYKKYTPAFLAKANVVAAVSEFHKALIVDQYKMTAGKITVIKPGIAAIFKPVEWDEKERTCEKYADGKAYFLFSGNINGYSNLINLLKAFSFFKTRQKSNMMLIIAANAGDDFKKELHTYKYRDHVKLLEHLPAATLAAITAAAWAMVYPVLFTGIDLPPLQAMQCGVPVVAADTEVLHSICGDAALYADPASFKDIAENMMLLYKDENRARELVLAGKAVLEQYQWDRSAALLMQCIREAVDN